MAAKKNDTQRSNGTANKLARRNNRSSGSAPEQAEYEALNHTTICKLIDAVAGQGGTVTFGYTRDGGAYYIGYYLDGESSKIYVRPNENPDLLLANEIDWWLE